jgi:hypothetical protein
MRPLRVLSLAGSPGRCRRYAWPGDLSGPPDSSAVTFVIVASPAPTLSTCRGSRRLNAVSYFDLKNPDRPVGG